MLENTITISIFMIPSQRVPTNKVLSSKQNMQVYQFVFFPVKGQTKYFLTPVSGQKY